jgi:3'-phosphoadenosine 5'-phosphosulfate sulfotransferase (PAPS reductase)/FAD synthetase
VSGGKDSTAVALLLKEVGIPYEAIHFDTGWEHPLTEAYVRETLPDIIGPIKIMQGRFSGFAEMVKKKGMFPSRVRRFCTQELKVKPFITYLKQRQLDGDDPVSAVGIRAAESQARSTLEEWEENESYDCEVWRPIIAWSEQDVIDMHAKHGIIPNPLYLKGARRVGCWPCIFSAKKEIRLLAQIDPKRTAEIEALEAEVQESARARYAARGETFESLGYAPPTMFMPSSGGSNMPFSEVVAWSKTARGGKYLDPKQTDARAGCMRWGLCDVVNTDEEDEDDAGVVHDGPAPDLAENERCE